MRDVVRPPTSADPTLVAGVLDLVAGMTGTPKDRLTGEDITQQRKRRSWIRTVVAGLALLTVVSVTVAYLAVDQFRAAVAGQRLAIARQLVAQAEAAPGSDPRTALQLNEAALRISAGAETEASLIHDLIDTRYTGTLDGRTGSLYAMAFSPDGRTLATAGADHTVVLWNLDNLNALLQAPMDRACAITGQGLDRSQWTRYISSFPYEETCSGA